MVAAAAAAALAYELQRELVCAIVEQESSWINWKIRYEPDFFKKYILPQYVTNKFDITEAHARSISWGLMQTMGETAREFGFTGDLASLCDPVIGLDMGCKIIAHKIGITHSVAAALEHWNGGANPNYAEEVLARIPHYAQG